MVLGDAALDGGGQRVVAQARGTALASDDAVLDGGGQRVVAQARETASPDENLMIFYMLANTAGLNAIIIGNTLK